MEYTLSLALVDFLPVLFAAFGYFYIFRLVSFVLPVQGRIALLGGILVVTGGLSRAIWKVLMASSEGTTNPVWLENAMFILMAPGYILLAWSVWQTARSVQGKRIFGGWLLPVTIILIVLLTSFYRYNSDSGSLIWERILLTTLVFATLLTGILLVIFAFRLQLTRAAGLFLVSLVIVLVMNGLARQSEQPIRLQWVEEVLNTVSWLAFAVGARILYQYARTNFGVDATATPCMSAIFK
jgi:hypothetical protein